MKLTPSIAGPYLQEAEDCMAAHMTAMFVEALVKRSRRPDPRVSGLRAAFEAAKANPGRSFLAR